MSLKCKGCGSRETEVVSARELSEKTGDASVMTAAAGAINPVIVIEAINSVFKALGKLFGFLEEKEKGNKQVVVCKDCGYWERV